ncbi:hypothetical protein GGTG_07803 [Gaeumannomyces tritici R3-111a-1]|uniref:Uncharacterized protein n=1 Tax=Gaeumannomyces tritici (strain R3-111a-1) TaxID=644352 RepID=J3P2Q8_GAET3|nr:hypothetical protein GGTG_07803 [Gaeumannomyces tritici R3-111a-1]EJT73950.1 hypothetical protein GGTG_07803 [Gaeumannomyces tritici R3-111a-1]
MSTYRRRPEVPVESSWRMVEGEHDSFDTSIVPDDEDIILSSDPSQLSFGSAGLSFGNSQDDNLQNFVNKAEDEKVILRTPFRPSVPPSVRHASTGELRHPHSPDPEFYMPTISVDSSRRGSSRSVATIRAGDGHTLRQRQPLGDISPRARPRARESRRAGPESEEADLGGRLANSVPAAVLDVFGWTFGVVGQAFRYLQKPLAVVLAIYLFFGGLIIAQNMATKSLMTSLSPICRIPGMSWLDLPFCPNIVPRGAGKGGSGGFPVEFEGLMNIQDRFEEVLEKSVQGADLPMEMRRTEMAVRDLRTMVRYSHLQSKDELLLEFDGFIKAAGATCSDLTRFNTRVGSAIDSVISINRWTSRYISSLTTEKESQGWVSDVAAWALAPFQPVVLSDQVILEQYVEHTALVSDKIASLVVEAEAVLRTLGRADEHLGTIYDFVTRTQKSVQSRKGEILWTLWTLVGANNRPIHNLNEQLSLLRTVDGQRASAVRQVSDLVLELLSIQAELGDLRDRVASPELAQASNGGGRNVPLSVHIETIDRGVERLEQARDRIRTIEDDKVRQVLARGHQSGPADGNMIESS